MPTRREFLELIGGGASLTLAPAACRRESAGVWVNDVHSGLNATQVRRDVAIDSVEALRAAIKAARAEGKAISIAGGRHAMGGQQFGAGSVLLDTRPLKRVLDFDAARGHLQVEAGIQWPELIDTLLGLQQGAPKQWSIVQKQTGADRLTLGGALGSNIHGRGLRFRPFIQDVESFTLMDANGDLRVCSRSENDELFRLAIGGYGLFGVVTGVQLRLMPRTKLERVVEIVDVGDLMERIGERIDAGYLYGDCQFSTDVPSPGFLKTGVFSSYRPLPEDTPMPAEHKELGEADWRELYYLAHADTKRTYETYSSYYLSTNGQKYWSDTHQLSTYIDGYHREVDMRLSVKTPGSEMITELYVPRAALPAFLDEVREDIRRHGMKLIYGTIRMIERDGESFLAWARESWACIVMNLHVDHDAGGIRKAEGDFRRLIDRAIRFGGSYFLTYHRWAEREQVESCYPQLPEFLRMKRKYDPLEVFQSEWYRHYKAMFADS